MNVRVLMCKAKTGIVFLPKNVKFLMFTILLKNNTQKHIPKDAFSKNKNIVPYFDRYISTFSGKLIAHNK